MKTLKLSAAVALAATFTPAAVLASAGGAQKGRPQTTTSKTAEQVRREKFRHNGLLEDEGPADPNAGVDDGVAQARAVASETPTGFDNLTNGFAEQGPATGRSRRATS